MSIDKFISKQLSKPAGIGGKLVFSVMNRQNRPFYDDVIKLLSITDSDSVLDIGCGNGNVLNMLASRRAFIFGIALHHGTDAFAHNTWRVNASGNATTYIAHNDPNWRHPDTI